MKKSFTIPILDIPGLASFQHLHGNPPELSRHGTRVIAHFRADNIFDELAAKFNQNESVPVLDFLNAQRQLKAKMYALKGDIR